MKAIYKRSLFALILAMPSLGLAQSYGHLYHAYIGIDGLNTTAVNNWMPSELGLPALKNRVMSIGIDGFAVRRNILIGGQLQVKHGSVVSNQAGNLRPYLADIMVQTGYIWLRKNGFIAYGTLGVGYGAFGAHLFNTRKRYPDFVPSEVATRENVVFIQPGVVGSVALGADYLFGKPTAQRTKGLLLGLRIGYDIRPSSTRWQANEASLSNGPAYAASGGFVRLTIGTGRLRTN